MDALISTKVSAAAPPGDCRRRFGVAGGGQRGTGLRCVGTGADVWELRLPEPLSLRRELRVGLSPVMGGCGLEWWTSSCFAWPDASGQFLQPLEGGRTRSAGLQERGVFLCHCPHVLCRRLLEYRLGQAAPR